jgi:hypothetical protein
MRSRSFRRHQLKRVKEKARFIKRQVWGMFTNIFVRSPSPLSPVAPGEEDPRIVGLGASTHCKPCSCPGCGNPRRHFGGNNGMTRQEKLSELFEAEQMQELEDKNK